MKEKVAAEAQERFVAGQRRPRPREFRKLVGEAGNAVVVAQQVMGRPVRAHRDQPVQPVQGCIDCRPHVRQGAPTEIKHVTVQDQDIGGDEIILDPGEELVRA
jgi:hypothetical protein